MNRSFRNPTVDKRLVEGDIVVCKSSGREATVIAFDLSEGDSVVIRDNDSNQISTVRPSDITLSGRSGIRLEPLPPVVTMLNEDGIKGGIKTCGEAVCLQIIETNAVLTLIPKTTSNLKEVYERACKQHGFKRAVRTLLEMSYITRLPHLVSVGDTTDDLINQALKTKE